MKINYPFLSKEKQPCCGGYARPVEAILYLTKVEGHGNVPVGRPSKKYRFLSKMKLHPPIETVWSLNFRVSTPTLYVKNKMAEASLLPQKIFLGHSRVFLFRT